MSHNHYQWETVDFRPAPAGWRLVYWFPDEQKMELRPCPGWLIQEQRAYDSDTYESATTYDDSPPDRRVVAATIGSGSIHVDDEVDDATLYGVIGPGESPPPENALSEEMDRRQRILQRIPGCRRCTEKAELSPSTQDA